MIHHVPHLVAWPNDSFKADGFAAAYLAVVEAHRSRAVFRVSLGRYNKRSSKGGMKRHDASLKRQKAFANHEQANRYSTKRLSLPHCQQRF